MPRYLISVAVGLLGVSPMALSAPVSSACLNSMQSFTVYPTINTTNPLDEPRGNWEDAIITRDFPKDKWAQFCDDANCSQNCGISVDMGNSGCLEQPSGRKSIKIHGQRGHLDGIGPRVSPQASPFVTATSPAFPPMDYCWDISMFEWYELHTEWSFRFQLERKQPWCGPDQCHWDNAAIPTLGALP